MSQRPKRSFLEPYGSNSSRDASCVGAASVAELYRLISAPFSCATDVDTGDVCGRPGCIQASLGSGCVPKTGAELLSLTSNIMLCEMIELEERVLDMCEECADTLLEEASNASKCCHASSCRSTTAAATAACSQSPSPPRATANGTGYGVSRGCGSRANNATTVDPLYSLHSPMHEVASTDTATVSPTAGAVCTAGVTTSNIANDTCTADCNGDDNCGAGANKCGSGSSNPHAPRILQMQAAYILVAGSVYAGERGLWSMQHQLIAAQLARRAYALAVTSMTACTLATALMRVAQTTMERKARRVTLLTVTRVLHESIQSAVQSMGACAMTKLCQRAQQEQQKRQRFGSLGADCMDGCQLPVFQYSSVSASPSALWQEMGLRQLGAEDVMYVSRMNWLLAQCRIRMNRPMTHMHDDCAEECGMHDDGIPLSIDVGHGELDRCNDDSSHYAGSSSSSSSSSENSTDEDGTDSGDVGQYVSLLLMQEPTHFMSLLLLTLLHTAGGADMDAAHTTAEQLYRSHSDEVVPAILLAALRRTRHVHEKNEDEDGNTCSAAMSRRNRSHNQRHITLMESAMTTCTVKTCFSESISCAFDSKSNNNNVSWAAGLLTDTNHSSRSSNNNCGDDKHNSNGNTRSGDATSMGIGVNVSESGEDENMQDEASAEELLVEALTRAEAASARCSRALSTAAAAASSTTRRRTLTSLCLHRAPGERSARAGEEPLTARELHRRTVGHWALLAAVAERMGVMTVAEVAVTAGLELAFAHTEDNGKSSGIDGDMHDCHRDDENAFSGGAGEAMLDRYGINNSTSSSGYTNANNTFVGGTDVRLARLSQRCGAAVARLWCTRVRLTLTRLQQRLRQPAVAAALRRRRQDDGGKAIALDILDTRLQQSAAAAAAMDGSGDDMDEMSCSCFPLPAGQHSHCAYSSPCHHCTVTEQPPRCHAKEHRNSDTESSECEVARCDHAHRSRDPFRVNKKDSERDYDGYDDALIEQILTAAEDCRDNDDEKCSHNHNNSVQQAAEEDINLVAGQDCESSSVLSAADAEDGIDRREDCFLSHTDWVTLLTMLTEALQLSPDDAEAHYLSGAMHVMQVNYTPLALSSRQRSTHMHSAVGHFCAALRAAPHMTCAHVGLAAVREAQGMTKVSVAHYAQAAELAAIEPLFPLEYFMYLFE